MEDTMTESFGPVIHAYSRAEALRDGVLVDAGDFATQAGFRYPVALTATAYADAVRWDQMPEEQDETGRLWDVLVMAARSVSCNPGLSRADFRVLRVPNRPGALRPRPTHLSVVIGLGDDGSPVITVMLTTED